MALRPSAQRGAGSSSLVTVVAVALIITVTNYLYYHQATARGDGYRMPLRGHESWHEVQQPSVSTTSHYQDAALSLPVLEQKEPAQFDTPPAEAQSKSVHPVGAASATAIKRGADKYTSWLPESIPRATVVKTKSASCDPAKIAAPANFRRPLNPRPTAYKADCPVHLKELCSFLELVQEDGEVLTLIAEEQTLGLLSESLASFRQKGPNNILILALDDTTASFLEGVQCPYIRTSEAGSVEEIKWKVLQDILELGCNALVADVAVAFRENPFMHLTREVDVEAMLFNNKESSRTARGKVVGIDDAAMGWSRYAQTMSVAMVSTGMLYVQATEQGFSLAQGVAMASEPKHLALNRLLIMPAHDGVSSPGATLRILDPGCFAYSTTTQLGQVAVHTASDSDPVLKMKELLGHPDSSGKMRQVVHRLMGRKIDPELKQTLLRDIPAAGRTSSSNELISSHDMGVAKELVLSQGCAPQPRQGPPPRELNYVVPLDAEFPPSKICQDLELQGLCDVVGRVANDREVLAAVSNKNIFHMLKLYFKGVRASNVSNAMVVALDEETGEFCRKEGFPYWVRTLRSRTGSTDNHATSGLKFQILRDFMNVGVNVVLSDVDIVWLDTPFKYLYRDSDVEGMTDGWDDKSAYGWEWFSTTTGWPEPVAVQRNIRLSARNSGLFFLQATKESLRMMDRLANRMASEDTWDQTAYNEEQFYSHFKEYHVAGVSSRVMNYLCFMNSKVLFRFVREDTELYTKHRPVAVHVNYHPEKPQRMVDIIKQYWEGTPNAIGKWHWGQGLKINKACTERSNQKDNFDTNPTAKKMATEVKAVWGGVKYVEFQPNGVFKTPWGVGSWGLALSGKDKFFADFVGTQHLLELIEWPTFKCTRCSDGDEIRVVFEA